MASPPPDKRVEEETPLFEPGAWHYSHDTGVILLGNDYSTLVLADLAPFDGDVDRKEHDTPIMSEDDALRLGRMMAAAPDLFAAAQAAAEFIVGHNTVPAKTVYGRLMAALGRALTEPTP